MPAGTEAWLLEAAGPSYKGTATLLQDPRAGQHPEP